MRLDKLVLAASVASGVLAGCGTREPVYLRPTPLITEVDPASGITTATSTLVLPIRTEDANEAIERQRLADALMLDLAQVPQARRDDYEVSIEWTVKNLDDVAGQAVVDVVGANEFWRYDRMAFVVDPEEDAPPPPLAGGIPVDVPPLGQVSGVFREDHLFEAAQDLDAITRAGVIPQRAMLFQWDTPNVTQAEGLGMGGELMEIPSAAIPAIVQLDVSLTANTHMVLEYVVRVRDHGDRLSPFSGDDVPKVMPSTAVYTPPPPAMP